MKREYDFSHARRGAVIRNRGSKERITIRLDRPIIDWFRRRVEEQGFGNYQTLINSVLRAHVEQEDGDRSRYPENVPEGRLEVREGATPEATSVRTELALLSRRVAQLEAEVGRRRKPGTTRGRRTTGRRSVGAKRSKGGEL